MRVDRRLVVINFVDSNLHGMRGSATRKSPFTFFPAHSKKAVCREEKRSTLAISRCVITGFVGLFASNGSLFGASLNL